MVDKVHVAMCLRVRTMPLSPCKGMVRYAVAGSLCGESCAVIRGARMATIPCRRKSVSDRIVVMINRQRKISMNHGELFCGFHELIKLMFF